MSRFDYSKMVLGALLFFGLLHSVVQAIDNQALPQQPSSPPGNFCVPLNQPGLSTGGRKIGLVIDMSLSMADNDPYNIRFNASQSLNDALLPSMRAASLNQSADSIAVIFFAGTSEIAYPLGDPSGAETVLQTPGSIRPDTFIGSGVRDALAEINGPLNSTESNKSAIVVLTDGEDSQPEYRNVTIEQLNIVADLGIPIYFGFLVPSIQGSDIPVQDPEITAAVLRSQGRFTTLDSDAAQELFIRQILNSGLTLEERPEAGAPIPLYPGLNTTALLDSETPTTFSFPVQAGEQFNITLTTSNTTELTGTLNGSQIGTEVQQLQTNSSGVAFIEHVVNQTGSLSLTVSTSEDAVGNHTFSVYLQSAFGPGSQGACAPFIPEEGKATRFSMSTGSVATMLFVFAAFLLV